MTDSVHCQRCGGACELRPVEDRSRPVCTACGFVTYLDPKLAVAVLIAQDGRVLLGRRGPGTREPGKWSFPAGFVERGEVVEEAARREAREESGLDVTLGPLLALLSTEGETVVVAVYPAVAWTGEPDAGDDLTEIGWFPADDLPELAFPHDRRIIDRWLETQRP